MSQLNIIVLYERIFRCWNICMYWKARLDLTDWNISILLFDRRSSPILNIWLVLPFSEYWNKSWHWFQCYSRFSWECNVNTCCLQRHIWTPIGVRYFCTIHHHFVTKLNDSLWHSHCKIPFLWYKKWRPELSLYQWFNSA